MAQQTDFYNQVEPPPRVNVLGVGLSQPWQRKSFPESYSLQF